MRAPRLWFAVIITALVTPSLADAQVISRPLRVYRGLFGGGADPNRWTPNLTFVANVIGGLDDNLTPTAGDSGINTPVQGSRGSTAFVAALANFRLAKGTSSSIEGVVRGFANLHRGIDVEPVYGGSGQLRVSAPLGRRTLVTGNAQFRDDPMFTPVVGVPPSPLATDIPQPAPAVTPTSEFLIRRWQTMDGSVSIQRRVTTRDSVDLSGSVAANRYPEGAGDNDRRSFMAGLSHRVGRNSDLLTRYNFTDTRSQFESTTRPLQSHEVTLGFNTTRRLSATRHLSITAGAGMMQIETVSGVSLAPLEYWTPAGNASVRMDLTRNWNVAAYWSRSVSLIEGVTLDSFVGDSLTAQLGGLLGSRTDFAFSGQIWTSQAGVQSAGSYTSYMAIAQVQHQLTRWLSAMVSHTFYTYEMRQVETIMPGLPTALERNAFRAGFVVTLPLIGTYTETRRAGGR